MRGFKVVDARKKLVHGANDDAWIVWSAGDGVGLSTASSAVSKDGSVVAIEDAVDERESGVVEDVLLGGGLRKDAIKRVSLVFVAFHSRASKTHILKRPSGVVVRGIKDEYSIVQNIDDTPRRANWVFLGSVREGRV